MKLYLYRKCDDQRKEKEMGLTFWDTIRGHHLADTLIRCLPKLCNPPKKENYCVRVDTWEEAKRAIEAASGEGHHYIDGVKFQESTLLVFEKDAK